MINLYGKPISYVADLKSAAFNLSNNKDFKLVMEYLTETRTQELLKDLLRNDKEELWAKRQETTAELIHIEYVKELMANLLTFNDEVDNT